MSEAYSKPLSSISEFNYRTSCTLANCDVILLFHFDAKGIVL
jgi:hypothetical protein